MSIHSVLMCVSMHRIPLAKTCLDTHTPHRALIAGGGAPEIEVSQLLMSYSQSLTGMEAMEIIPYTLAENAGLNPITVVTELRNRHAKGEKNAGINVRKVCPCLV